MFDNPNNRQKTCRPIFVCKPTFKTGAVDWDRTSDLLVTNELLCQLSYNGVLAHYIIIKPVSEISPSDI